VIMGLMIMSSDMCYALQDEIFDVNEGLYSFPAVYGTEMTRIAVQVTHAVIIGLICVLGQGLSSVIMVLSCFILIGVFVRVTDYDDSTTMNILNLNVTMAIFSSLLLEVLWQFMY
jgi:4-hydroxybenzoate polyprenyltransferase